MADQKPIILWSHPRSLSTVFEQPFLKYPQEFHVIHEPLNQIGRAYVTKNFEFLNQILLSKPTDPINFVHHFSPALNEILSPHYNDDKTHTLKVFVKDHASNFLEALEGNLEGNTLGSKEILLKFKHTFIIRNLKKSVKSFYKAANSICKAWDENCIPNSERYDIFCPKKVWLKDSRILYDLIKNITREKIVLIDADNLVREPEKI
ncbi:branched-chain-amino-acid aminotransferase-like protein 1 [Gigaspora margarita]|uniref:Branched-chain-amino-acid aminotransferase-like protein 1 n=1 Tax=Gigaspora margarita TaxID=4874 RepID=A0A8H4AVD3_GIGMA|nr:branched-chain-amino-acid aminotransferase-like protein 1 [Gigaspora margarita]